MHYIKRGIFYILVVISFIMSMSLYVVHLLFDKISMLLLFCSNEVDKVIVIVDSVLKERSEVYEKYSDGDPDRR